MDPILRTEVLHAIEVPVLKIRGSRELSIILGGGGGYFFGEDYLF